MRELAALLVMVSLLMPGQGQARTDIVAAGIDGAQNLGRVTVRWFGVPLYDAALYIEGGERFSWQVPMALELAYRREISGERLVEATARELERIEGSRRDHPIILEKLESCFRDVAQGDRFLAVAQAGDRVDFWFNGARVCEVRHENLRKRFLGIWLSDDARSIALSRRLRGQ
ncbi:chalcone isomerase family protein [Aquicoccus sp.]|uniref:chalcone isomerase family protein n=1 Tax=Aquicoccus sp. TaxID=2055851 RepID=UPI0035630794